MRTFRTFQKPGGQPGACLSAMCLFQMTRAFLPILTLVSLIALLNADLEAGSVFMKNGYIIQGLVVQQDDEMVVLGWPNGKVFIPRRFMESVVLEPEDREAIARTKLQPESASELPQEQDVVIPGGHIGEELPENFQDMLKLYNLESHGVTEVSDFGGGSETPVEPSGTGSETPLDNGDRSGTVPDVGPVPRPGKLLGPRQEHPEFGLSIEAPQGWAMEKSSGSLQWTGPAEKDRFLPNLVIVTSTLEEWDLNEARRSLREDPAAVLPDFDVLQEGEKTVGGRDAFELIGQAVSPPPSAGEKTSGKVEPVTLSIDQILIPGKTRFWIVSAFSSENTSEESLLALHRSMESIRFTEQETAGHTGDKSSEDTGTGRGVERR